MKDSLLNGLLAPTNMLFSMARWPDGSWHIQSASAGRNDLYRLIAELEGQKSNLYQFHRQVMSSGAVAHEYAILRPTWNEIEEFTVSREDLT